MSVVCVVIGDESVCCPARVAPAGRQPPVAGGAFRGPHPLLAAHFTCCIQGPASQVADLLRFLPATVPVPVPACSSSLAVLEEAEREGRGGEDLGGGHGISSHHSSGGAPACPPAEVLACLPPCLATARLCLHCQPLADKKTSGTDNASHGALFRHLLPWCR